MQPQDDSAEPGLASPPTSAATLVPREALAGRIDSFLLDRMDQGRPAFPVRELAPRLTWNRLDIAIKLYYLEQSELRMSIFAEELYDAHIHAFSLGDFREPGNDVKTDPASFRSAFRTIAESVRIDGFDPDRSLIPVASDGSFINGGHRAACALFLNRRVHVVETGLPPVRYDHRFFRSRGMDDDLLEAAIVKYMERSPRSRLALVWPGAGDARQIEATLGPLIYRKEFRLTTNGAASLVDFLRDEVKATDIEPSRFRPDRRHLVLAFDQDDPAPFRSSDAMPEAPERRPDGVHLLSSHERSLDLARLLLNERSVRFLNAASPKRFASTSRLTADFRAALERSEWSTESAVLDSGMLLAVSGIHEARTADFMSPLALADAAASASVVQQTCGAEIKEILQDPRRHLHHGGLKFLSVSEAVETARSRRSPEALDHLRHLASLRQQDTSRGAGRSVLYRLRLYHSKLRRSAIHVIGRLGLRDQAKAAYRALRRTG